MAGNEAERRERGVGFEERALRQIQEEEEETQRQAAIARCDRCPKEKQTREQEWTLPNGLVLWTQRCQCADPGPDCTAQVDAQLKSETPATANRIVDHLVEAPVLKAAGVHWMCCLHPAAERLFLTFPGPSLSLVLAVVGALRVEHFRE
jgi:hypothetical protein